MSAPSPNWSGTRGRGGRGRPRYDYRGDRGGQRGNHNNPPRNRDEDSRDTATAGGSEPVPGGHHVQTTAGGADPSNGPGTLHPNMFHPINSSHPPNHTGSAGVRRGNIPYHDHEGHSQGPLVPTPFPAANEFVPGAASHNQNIGVRQYGPMMPFNTDINYGHSTGHQPRGRGRGWDQQTPRGVSSWRDRGPRGNRGGRGPFGRTEPGGPSNRRNYERTEPLFPPPKTEHPEQTALETHQRTPVIAVNTPEISSAQLLLTSKAYNKQAAGARKITDHMYERGLRTDFGAKGDPGEVLTNFFKISHRPAFLFVYKLTLVRRWYRDDDGLEKAVYVKNKVEKEALFGVMKGRPEMQHLTRNDCWVTDYDMIWSTQRLIDGEEFDIEEMSVEDLKAVNPTTSKTIDAKAAYIRFNRVIDLSKTIGELFNYSTGRTKGEEDEDVLVRGLNAIATAYARERAEKTAHTISVGANKFYNTRSSELSSTLDILRGCFASVRPGAQSLLLNISLKCSPFLKQMTVYEYMRLRRFVSPRAVSTALKGVQVEISSSISQNTGKQQLRRIITGIGKPIKDQELNNGDKRYGINTVLEFYSGSLLLERFVTSKGEVTTEVKDSYAINVGGRPNRKGQRKKEHENQEEPEWYPPQFLTITGYHPYHDKLGGTQTSKMIKMALKDPAYHLEDIKVGATMLFGINAADFQLHLKNNFGIQLDTELMKVPCRTLPPPRLVYRNAAAAIAPETPVRAAWNLKGCRVREVYITSRIYILDLSTLRISNGNGHLGKTNTNIPVAHQDSVQIGGANIEFDGEAETESSGYPMTQHESSNEATSLNPQFSTVMRKAMEDLGLDSKALQEPYRPNLLEESDSVEETIDISEDRLYAIFGELLSKDTAFTAMKNITVLVAIPVQSASLYATIKRVAELRMGLKTVCFIASKVVDFGAYNQKHQMVGLQHCANIALKLNIKGEGDNHHIDRSILGKLYDSTSGIEGDLATQNANTIVIGADVTHPMGHCAPGCPSIAAVVGSTDDNFAQFPGSMRLQRSRKEVITELPHMVMERLLDWAAHHEGKLPTSVLFYRDGVSESQYEEVRASEIPAVTEAFILAASRLDQNKVKDQTEVADEMLSDARCGPSEVTAAVSANVDENKSSAANNAQAQNDCPSFKLTFVIVGKRHNTRFFAEKQLLPGPEAQPGIFHENVEPGCVVDQGITHPYLFDFYLQSHQPIKGTGRSAHYVVLQNNMRLSADELQNITNAFCYNYARATKGVSYCAPAYYADRLCDRGRSYIRHWLTDGDNNNAVRDRAQEETAEHFNDDVKDFLHRNKYYRPHQGLPQKYSGERQNPWRENLDNTMFYL